MSKRQCDTAVEDYIQKGYLPEALVNFVAFLGWNPGDEREIFSLKELVKEFSLEKAQKAGAVFNLEKLNWYSGMYIRELSAKDLGKKLIHFYEKKKLLEKTDSGYAFTQFPGAIPFDEEYFEKGVGLSQERLKNFEEFYNQSHFFFHEDLEYEKALLTHEKMKVDSAMAKKALEESEKVLKDLKDWSEEKIKEVLLELVQKLDVKNGQVLWPFRAALTGENFSPGAFECAEVLGKEQTLKRIKQGLGKL